MGDTHNSKNIRFNLNSDYIRGSFILSFEPYIVSRINEELEDFSNSLANKQNKKGLHIQKKGDSYEINLKTFLVICNKVFSILKNP